MNNRREIIRYTGLAAIGSIAGCIDVGGDDNDTTEETEPQPEITNISFESIEGRCTNADSSQVQAERMNETISVTGFVIGGNPCYEASLSSSNIQNDMIVLSISLSQTTDSNEVCQECLGEMSFNASVDVDGEVNSVRIRTSDEEVTTEITE